MNNKQCVKCRSELFFYECLIHSNPKWRDMCYNGYINEGGYILKKCLKTKDNLCRFYETIEKGNRLIKLRLSFFYELYNVYKYIKKLWKSRYVQFVCCKCYYRYNKQTIYINI